MWLAVSIFTFLWNFKSYFVLLGDNGNNNSVKTVKIGSDIPFFYFTIYLLNLPFSILIAMNFYYTNSFFKIEDKDRF